MMVGSFDSGAVSEYLLLHELWATIFATSYIISSLFSLLATSVATIMFMSRTVIAKGRNLAKTKTEDNVFIFCDPNVKVAVKLAEKLRDRHKDAVRIVIPRSYLRTQEGTEFRDSLLGKGFDVWVEMTSVKFFYLLFKKHWLYGRKNSLSLYGLFSDDDVSIKFANQIKRALLLDKKFVRIKEQFDKYQIDVHDYYSGNLDKASIDLDDSDLDLLNRLKVFVSYQDFDCDCIYNYTSETFGIINTFSQYDIVSTNFIMDNPLSKFLDIKALIRDEKNDDIKGLNVSFLGFGKINQEIFKKMVSAYQLWGDNKSKIDYHILDSNSEDLVKLFDGIYSNNNGKDLANGKLEVPNLFNIYPEFQGGDLNNRVSLDNYVKDIISNELDHRFTSNGLELFIVSAGQSSVSARIAFFLRKALLSKLSKEQLKNTYIYVRIGNKDILDVYSDSNEAVITQQEFLDHKNEGLIAPIITFGEDSLISDYVHGHLSKQYAIGLEINHHYEDMKVVGKKEATANFLTQTKESILSNIGVLWQVKSKLAIFDLYLSDNYQIVDKDGKELTLEEFKALLSPYLPDPSDIKERTDTLVGKRILEMEHNRWTMMVDTLYGYYPYPFDEYILKPNKTKDVDRALHICMTTNEGLKILEKEVLSRCVDIPYDPSSGISEEIDKKNKEKIRKRMANVCYYSDVNGLYYLFESL